MAHAAVAAMLVVACGGRSSDGAVVSFAGRTVDTIPGAADSIAIVRTRCFGTCPAYRVVVTRDGIVRFVSHDDMRSGVDSIDPAGFQHLMQRAQDAGHERLPKAIRPGSEYCAVAATDHSTATVTVFGRARPRSVEHYLGCRDSQRRGASAENDLGRLAPLLALERAIDSVAGVSRWTR